MLNGKVFSVSQFSVGSWNLLRSTQFPFCDRSAIASPGDHAAPAVLHRCCFQGAGSTWGTRLGPARTLLLPRCFLDAWRKRKDTLRIWYSKCGKLQVFEAPFCEDGLLLNLLQNSKKCYFLWMVYWVYHWDHWDGPLATTRASAGYIVTDGVLLGSYKFGGTSPHLDVINGPLPTT